MNEPKDAKVANDAALNEALGSVHRRKPRQVEIPWTPEGPDVSALTGTEARGVLRNVLIQNRQAEQLRVRLVKLLAALVWRDCTRGILGMNGEPVMPMRTVIPADAAAAGNRAWQATWRQAPDGSVEIEVSPGPGEVEGPRVLL